MNDTLLADEAAVKKRVKDTYASLNEGLGGCYERIAYSDVLLKFCKRYNVRRVLELNASYIAGIPGYNSCLLSQNGLDVTVAVCKRDIMETAEVWRTTKLKVDIVPLEKRLPDNSFDLVWNHLAFDQYENPTSLVMEMRRLSKNLIANFTLSPWNYGFWIHKLAHGLYRKPWDHGKMSHATIGAMKDAHSRAALKVLEADGCDCPPWMDTVDAEVAGSMTYFDIFPRKVRDNWVWTTANPACQEHKVVRTLLDWEREYPRWFRILMCHHLYVVSSKGED